MDRVLEALDRVNRDFPVKDQRYTLIHAYFPNPSAVRRAAELGVCVDTQPDWFYKDGDALANALGESRLKSFIGLADWANGSVKTAINSDHMHGLDPNKSLNPFNPFLAMYVAVTRRMESGRVIGPEQRVSREQALRMATIDAAYLGFDEKRKGSIEAGKLGDLTMLSDDLLTCDVERIKDIQALLTVVGGKIVHGDSSRCSHRERASDQDIAVRLKRDRRNSPATQATRESKCLIDGAILIQASISE